MTGVSTAESWIPLTNHTPQREDFYGPSTGSDDDLEQKLRQVPLTESDGRSLRDDCLVDWGGVRTAVDTGEAVDEFERYLADKEDLSVVLEDLNSADGNRIKIDQSHRFETDYMTDQMGKFYALERKAVDEWGEDGLTMVMLTLSASVFDDSGDLLPPVDHLDSIMDASNGSWRAVRTAMGRAVGDRDFEYARILEPHTPDKGNYATSGYCHVHVGLFVRDPDESLSESDFSGVLSSHVSNCGTAGREAHTVENSVSLSRYDAEKDGGMGAYLTAYLGEQLDRDPRDAPDWMMRYMAVLWASGRRRVSFSNGAQDWIREDYEEQKTEEQKRREELRELFKLFDETEWVMVGVESNGEFTACESGGSGSYMSTVQMPHVAGQSHIADTSAPPRLDRLERQLRRGRH